MSITRRNYFFLTLITFLFFSCEKEVVEREAHENLVVDDNQIPPYNGVAALTIQNYINRMYIDLIGLEPTSTQMTNAMNQLLQNGLSDSARENVINGITASDGYFRRLNEITASNLLESIDSSTMGDQLTIYVYYRDQYIADSMMLEAQLLQFEIDLIEDLLDAEKDLKNGSLKINEFYARYIYNEFYDQINMGTLNFVLSCFENLMKRQPTDTELENASEMVDGGSSQLFLETGDSKGDFVIIITNSDEFYQGLVWDIYQSLLQRKPDSREMAEGIIDIKNSGTLKSLQTKVLKTNEYAGF